MDRKIHPFRVPLFDEKTKQIFRPLNSSIQQTTIRYTNLRHVQKNSKNNIICEHIGLARDSFDRKSCFDFNVSRVVMGNLSGILVSGKFPGYPKIPGKYMVFMAENSRVRPKNGSIFQQFFGRKTTTNKCEHVWSWLFTRVVSNFIRKNDEPIWSENVLTSKFV